MLLVNNTGAEIGPFERLIRDSVRTGEPLDRAIADLFAVRVVEVNGVRRIVVDWA